MSTETRYEHVALDDGQTAIIAGTTLKVKELVAERQAWGWSPEELLVNHPGPTLGQIFSALAYYADHAEEIDKAIEEDVHFAERLRRQREPSPPSHQTARSSMMAIAFYMDEHVPKPITWGLRIRGVDVLTAQDDGRRATDDSVLLERATELKRVVFLFDADMLDHATARQREGIPFTGLAFAHPTRISVGECIRELEMIATAANHDDLANQIVFLPL